VLDAQSLERCATGGLRLDHVDASPRKKALRRQRERSEIGAAIDDQLRSKAKPAKLAQAVLDRLEAVEIASGDAIGSPRQKPFGNVYHHDDAKAFI
jgi:hypothetical protein